jgi:hypothetical protein
MKLELNKREVELVIEARAWSKAVGEGQWKVTLAYFLMLAPIIIIPLSCMNLFIGGNTTVGSIFLFIGILMIPVAMKVVRKYKVAKSVVMKEVVSEEHKEV